MGLPSGQAADAAGAASDKAILKAVKKALNFLRCMVSSF
jgi:chitinase